MLVECTQAVKICLLGQKELFWVQFARIEADGNITPILGLW